MTKIAIGCVLALSILPISLLIVNYQYCNQPSYGSALQLMSSTQLIIDERIALIEQMHNNGTLHFKWIKEDGNARVGRLSIYLQRDIITIILPMQLSNQQQLIQQQFKHALQKLYQTIGLPNYNTDVRSYILHPSMIDRNIMQSVPMIFSFNEYMKSFWKQIEQITPLQHCAYSIGQCQQYFIYIGGNNGQSDGFSKIGQNKYAMQSYSNITTINILIDILDIRPLFQQNQNEITKEYLSKQYKYARQMTFLYQCKDILSYFMHTGASTFYQKSEQELGELHRIIDAMNKLINTQQNSNNQQAQLRYVHPLRDSTLGVLDPFPSDYFIGIHLPLYMLALYPLAMGMKILYAILTRIK